MTQFDQLINHDISDSPGSYRELLPLFEELLFRINSGINIPLILDGAFTRLSKTSMDIAFKILLEISKINQVIVFTILRGYEKTTLASSAHVVTELKRDDALSISPINHSLFYRSTDRKVEIRKTTPLKGQFKFIKGEVFDKEECISVEFKEVKGSNPLSSIKDIVDQYVVAFLNSSDRKKGSIYWGIRNEDRVITGLEFNYEQRDDLRRSLINRLYNSGSTFIFGAQCKLCSRWFTYATGTA